MLSCAVLFFFLQKLINHSVPSNYLGIFYLGAGFNQVLNFCESFLSWQSNETVLGYVNESVSVCISDHMEGLRKADIICFHMWLHSYFCWSQSQVLQKATYIQYLVPCLKFHQVKVASVDTDNDNSENMCYLFFIEKCPSPVEMASCFKIIPLKCLHTCETGCHEGLKVTEQIECTAAVCGTDNYPVVLVQKSLVSNAVDSVHIVYMEGKPIRYCFIDIQMSAYAAVLSIIFYTCIIVVSLCSLVIPHITHNAESTLQSFIHLHMVYIYPSHIFIWYYSRFTS